MPAAAQASNSAAKRLSAGSARSRIARSPGYSSASDGVVMLIDASSRSISSLGLGNDGTPGLLPAIDAAAQVARIQAGGAQAHRGGAADLVAVDAIHDHVAIGR